MNINSTARGGTQTALNAKRKRPPYDMHTVKSAEQFFFSQYHLSFLASSKSVLENIFLRIGLLMISIF